jgi:hypothetical protein
MAKSFRKKRIRRMFRVARRNVWCRFRSLDCTGAVGLNVLYRIPFANLNFSGTVACTVVAGMNVLCRSCLNKRRAVAPVFSMDGQTQQGCMQFVFGVSGICLLVIGRISLEHPVRSEVTFRCHVVAAVSHLVCKRKLRCQGSC